MLIGVWLSAQHLANAPNLDAPKSFRHGGPPPLHTGTAKMRLLKLDILFPRASSVSAPQEIEDTTYFLSREGTLTNYILCAKMRITNQHLDR